MQTDILFDKRRQEHLAKTRELFSSYMHTPKQLKTDLFLSFCSWPCKQTHKEGFFSFGDHEALFCAKNNAVQEGGYFLALSGHGVVINPDRHFFEKFCQKGYTLKDIDIVIASKQDNSIAEAICQLHTLNREFSRTLISYGQDPHIIRFFLHPDVYSAHSSLFRPIFRQELSSVISLETFTKSEEVRTINDELSLAYTKTEGKGLAVRLDAKDFSFGCIFQGGYHDGLKDFFSPCSIISSGVGNCSAEDLEKISLQTDALGYFGLSKLIEECPNLQLLLVSEFCKSMGDIRLELVQKLLSENRDASKVIALDENFCLHLDAYAVNTYDNTFCSFEDVRIVRPFGAFGPLLFLGCDDVV